MVEMTPARRRKRRSSATLERLDEARRRRAEQLERERDNERRVDEALGPFAEAVTAIEVAERKRDDKLDDLDDKLESKLVELDRQKAERVAEYDRLKSEVRARVDVEIAGWRAVMAESVRQIRSSAVTVSDAAAMLGIPVRDVTALAREGARDNASDAGDSRAESDLSPGQADRPRLDTGAGEPMAQAGLVAEELGSVDAAIADSGTAGMSGWLPEEEKRNGAEGDSERPLSM